MVGHIGGLGLCLVCDWVSIAMFVVDLGFWLEVEDERVYVDCI